MSTKKNRTRFFKTIIPLAAAFALLLALGAAAYALDWFGFRALLKTEADASTMGQAEISLAQPQAVPAEAEDNIAEKVDASRNAWAEWEDWREGYADELELELPEAFRTGGRSYGVEVNDDDSVTLRITVSDTERELRQATMEEYLAFCEIMERRSNFESAYDFNYWAQSSEADAALEAIAGKYDLALRGHGQVAWTRDGVTPEQLAEKTADMGNAGNIFRETPVDFDKVYWYDEGTFAVSYYAPISDGSTARCYGYNSMYATLSSGGEVISEETDIDAFGERSYIAADGTEVTILSNGESAYLYVYLENSFFAMHISAETALSDADIERIADGLNYSLMGR